MADDSSDDEHKRAIAPDADIHWYYNIIEQLSISGYHRARFVQLPDFHKVAGGLVFALSHFDNPACEGLKFEEVNNVDGIFERQTQIIFKALEATGCPVKIKVSDLTLMNCDKVEPVVRWCMTKFRAQSGFETNFTYFAEYFKKEYPNAEAASIDYRHRLHHPNSNFEYCASHWDLFDNNILFQQNLAARTILAQYYHYAAYGESIYPEKYIQLPTEDAAEAQEHLAALENDKKECIAQLEKIAETVFANLTPIQTKVVNKICRVIEALNFATKFYYNEKRFRIDGELVYKVNTENRMLEKNVKVALENSITFDVDAMEKLHEQLKKLNQRTKEFYVAVLKDLLATRTKEHELRMNKKNGIVQRYSVAKRELCDAYTEKRLEIEKIAQRVFKMISRLNACSKGAEGCRQRFNEMKAKHERDTRDHYDNFAKVDKGLLMQLNEYSITLDERIVEVKATATHKGDNAEEFRDLFMAYSSDIRNLVNDWLAKANILQSKFKDAIRRNNKLKLMFSKVQGESLFATAEFEKMFNMTRAIQEVSYELNQLESITGEFKKPCTHK